MTATALTFPPKKSYRKSVPELTTFIMVTGISGGKKIFGATKHNHFQQKIKSDGHSLGYSGDVCCIFHSTTLHYTEIPVREGYISLNKLTVLNGRWFAPNDRCNASQNDYYVHCTLSFVFSFGCLSHVIYLYSDLLSLESIIEKS
jgi:hypothetical protein